jgi:hypothetical protein
VILRSLRIVGLAAAWVCVWSIPAAAQHGSQDSYGYIIRGSHDGGNPYEYDFAQVNVPLEEEEFQTVSIPFDFPLYGTIRRSLEIHDNGSVSFGLTRALDFNHDCNGLGQTAPTIWAHWADMAPTQATNNGPGIFYSTLGEAPTRRFVVEWFGLPIWNVGGTMSFELKLFEGDGRIEFHYKDVKVDDGALNNGADAMVGMTDGTEVLLYSCNQATLSDPGTGEDEFSITIFPPCEDVDGDDFCPPPGPDVDDVDCDDTRSDVYPGAPELCDGIDNDCDGNVPSDEIDGDGDDVSTCQNDCNDSDPQIHPGAEEVCNGIDDDCNGTLPPSERDVDLDTFTPCQGDCDDNSSERNPADADEDGVDSCSGDCADDDPLILPGAAEQCDLVDNDCNGTVDDNPNCAGGPGGVQLDVPYGCLLACNAADSPGAGLWALALLPLAVRRRRAVA